MDVLLSSMVVDDEMSPYLAHVKPEFCFEYPLV